VVINQSWTHVSLLDAPGADSYSIASFSYLLLYKELSTNIDSMEKAQALVQFVNWANTDGQQFGSPLHYVPLPDSVVQHNQQTLRSLTFNGQPVFQQGLGCWTDPPSPHFLFPFSIILNLLLRAMDK
jgi:phosphate transport system substrate-binding protein